MNRAKSSLSIARLMADLFLRDKQTISRHIRNAFVEGERSRESVVANFTKTDSDGKKHNVDNYNLNVISSI